MTKKKSRCAMDTHGTHAIDDIESVGRECGFVVTVALFCLGIYEVMGYCESLSVPRRKDAGYTRDQSSQIVYVLACRLVAGSDPA